jgi:hypothetical protein
MPDEIDSAFKERFIKFTNLLVFPLLNFLR